MRDARSRIRRQTVFYINLYSDAWHGLAPSPLRNGKWMHCRRYQAEGSSSSRKWVANRTIRWHHRGWPESQPEEDLELSVDHKGAAGLEESQGSSWVMSVVQYPVYQVNGLSSGRYYLPARISKYWESILRFFIYLEVHIISAHRALHLFLCLSLSINIFLAICLALFISLFQLTYFCTFVVSLLLKFYLYLYNNIAIFIRLSVNLIYNSLSLSLLKLASLCISVFFSVPLARSSPFNRYCTLS